MSKYLGTLIYLVFEWTPKILITIPRVNKEVAKRGREYKNNISEKKGKRQEVIKR